jgi:hypothetical protein
MKNAASRGDSPQVAAPSVSESVSVSVSVSDARAATRRKGAETTTPPDTGSAPGHSRDQVGTDPSPCAVEQGSIGGDTAYQCSVTGRTWSQGSTVPARCPGHPSANGPSGARQGPERLEAVLSRVLADQPKPAGPDANDARPTGLGGPDSVGVVAPGRPGVAGPLGSARPERVRADARFDQVP